MAAKTMTAAQMSWNVKKGFAWFETEEQEWHLPIWTRQGGWMWDVTTQLYELCI